MSGKGDAYRPVDRAKYEENYARIFGDKAKPAKRLPAKKGRAKK